MAHFIYGCLVYILSSVLLVYFYTKQSSSCVEKLKVYLAIVLMFVTRNEQYKNSKVNSDLTPGGAASAFHAFSGSTCFDPRVGFLCLISSLETITTKKRKMSQEEARFSLSNNRFLTVSLFKNKVRVDIREYYMDDKGERRPGKKGISLSLDEWKKMKEQLGDIEKDIKKKGGELSTDESSSDD